MAEKFNRWLDRFVENGANPENVADWPEDAGGGTSVIANPELVGDEPELIGLEVDGTKYAVSGSDKILYDNLIAFNNFDFVLNGSNLNFSEHFIFGIHIISDTNLSKYIGNLYEYMQNYFGLDTDLYTPNIVIIVNDLKDANDKRYIATDITAYFSGDKLKVALNVLDSDFVRSRVTAQGNYDIQSIRSYPIN